MPGAAPKFLIDKLESSTQTHKELTFRLADPDVASDAKEFQKLSKALGELTGVVEQYARYKACGDELVEAKQMVKDAGGDAEMEEMAREEAAALVEEMEALEEDVARAAAGRWAEEAERGEARATRGAIGTSSEEASDESDETVSEGSGACLLYTSPSPRDKRQSRMPSSA